MDGGGGLESGKGCNNGDDDDDVEGVPARVTVDRVLRGLVMLTTLAAALVMGVARETETVPLQVVPTLPAIPITVHAKSSYSSAFLYFIVTNAIACAYALAYLIFSAANGGPGVGAGGRRSATAAWWLPIVTLIDLVIVGLLFSGIGAAAAIGMVGRRGNSHVGWIKICGVFGRFCDSVVASVVTSVFGSLVFLVVVTLSVWGLHKRSLKASGF